ncbi:hypothetical protein LEN26_006147 [Aphanomyces euteiches]|nr:hypothetical protein AeMF1_017062 [Aphanomyces euteiches]KAH9136477.1 hypothetical protein LEN26_006147 [Aphanomyces euteiches]KAH9191809.1 hypothetical protein AeNC1_006212 [Aphanomyces euteiches]
MIDWGNTDTVRDRRKREQAYQERHAQEKRLRGSANEEKISDEGAGTSADVEMAITASSGTTGGNRQDGSETAVDPFYAPRLRPFNDTQNTILPFYKTGTINLGTSDGAIAVGNFAIRLNSIWDCITVPTYTEDPNPATDTAGAIGQIETPILAEYLSLLDRRWFSLQGPLLQMPPLMTGGKVLYSKYRKLHRHAHMKVLHTYGATERTLFGNQITFEGDYRPGNYTVVNDVTEDEYKETWHKNTEVPSMREMADFILQRSERSDNTAGALIRFDIEIVYKVQWKDLESKFQYMEPGANETFSGFAEQKQF